MTLIQKAQLVAVTLVAMMAVGCSKNTNSTDGAKDADLASAPSALNDTGKSSRDDASDSVITNKIKAAFSAEPLLGKTDIKVDTKDGAVTLSGTTETQDQAVLAKQVAQSTGSAKTVNNELTVKTN